MSCFLYWCLRSLGYLFFALCAMAWINVGAGCVYLLIRLIIFLVTDCLKYAGGAIACAVIGYLLFLFGRYLADLSLKFGKPNEEVNLRGHL